MIILTEAQRKRGNQLEGLGYEVLGVMINKIRGRTSFHLADLTKEAEIHLVYSDGDSTTSKLGAQLEKRCKERGWKYLKNKKGLDAT